MKEWLNKSVPPYHGLPLNNRKECTVDTCNNLGKAPENYGELKTPIPNGYILYNSFV